MLDDAPLGYITAYDSHAPSLTSPVELWPEVRRRPEMLSTVQGYHEVHEHRDHQIALNVHQLMDVWDFLGQQALPWDFARSIVNIPKDQTLGHWLEEVGNWNTPGGYGALIHHTLRNMILPQTDASLHPSPRRAYVSIYGESEDSRQRTGRPSPSWRPAGSSIKRTLIA